MNMTEDELQKLLKDNPALSVAGDERPQPQPGLKSKLTKIDALPAVPVKHNKYHAERVEVGGRTLSSKKEARQVQELELRKAAGDIDFWLEQVSFPLPGIFTDSKGRQRRARHQLDFITFKKVGELYRVEFLETKGRDLPMGKLKRLQTEAIYHLKIEVK